MKFIFLLAVLLLTSTGHALGVQNPDLQLPITGVVGYSQSLRYDNVQRQSSIGFVVTATVSTPAAGSFTCSATTSICTYTANGFGLGTIVQVSTTGSLPTGLSGSTNYFTIPINANTFYFASSLANAQAGTHITISGAGSPTNTVTATALSGGTATLQVSMDGTTWVSDPIRESGDLTKSATISSTGSFFLGDDHINANFVRVQYALTAGQLTISQMSKVNWK